MKLSTRLLAISLLTAIIWCGGVLYTSNLSAQCPGCIADTSCKINPPYPTLCPDTLPDGRVMTPYDEDISFYLPEEFNAQGFDVVFDTLIIDVIYNVPFGLSWESSSPNDKFYPSSNPPATEHGCVKVCGTPLISGTYTITVFVTVYVDAPFVGTVMQQETFDIYITILPDTSGNASFAMTNSFGCGSVTTSFQTNYPSNGNPNYSYNWDFGNTLTSSAENPSPMTYNTPGTYSVSLQTTIDTLDYTLTLVEVLAADCNDFLSDPDFYLVLYEGGAEILNSLATTGSVTSNPPVSVPFPPTNLNDTTYTLEIWDEDGGLAGANDLCGSISFNGQTPGIYTITNGVLTVQYEITHSVLVFNDTSYVTVYPLPALPVLTASSDSACVGDSIILNTGYNANLQWYQDTIVLLGATDSFYLVYNSGSYWVELTDSNGCKAASDVYTITIENPPVDNITLNENLLISNVSGYNYQWYYNGSPIPGANQQFYLAQNAGNYYVVLSNDIGCSTQSNTVSYQLTGITEGGTSLRSVQVYPNPNDGSFILNYQLSEPQEILLRVKDMLGRSLYFQKFPKSSGAIRHIIELQGYPSGVYFVEIQTEKVSKTVKVAIK